MPINDQRTRRGRRGRASACVIAAATLALALPHSADAATFTVDPQGSELVVRTFKAGIASALAHDHVARASRFSGTVEYDPKAPGEAAVEITADAMSVVVDESELRRRYGLDEPVSEKSRAKIQQTMESPEQLDVERFSEIAFRSTGVTAAANGGLEVTGDFTLHGITRRVTLSVTVELDGATLRAEGSFRFLQSDYAIEPFSGGLGTVRNQDEIELIVRLEAHRMP